MILPWRVQIMLSDAKRSCLRPIFELFEMSMSWHKNRVLKMHSRDSSVGRASDWRSEGPWFNPGSRHFQNSNATWMRATTWIRKVRWCILQTLQCFLRSGKHFSKLENPGIDPGASRMQIERSTTWANPPYEIRVSKTMQWHEYIYFVVSNGDDRRMFCNFDFVRIRTYFSDKDATTDSSVGRAGDCRSDTKSDISRSLVQIRLGGLILRNTKL